MRRSPRNLRLFLLPVLLGLLACSTAPPPAPEPGPTHPAGATPTLGAKKPAADVRGRIARIDRGGSGGTILVEGSLEADTRYDRASVRITSETKITRRGDPVPFGELAVGNLVEATFTGPVAESHPVQATAAEVAILESEPVEQ